MHHSDFNTIELLEHTALEREHEQAWIRRYHQRKILQQRAKKESFTDCIYWIASILLILGMINAPTICHLVASIFS